MAAITGEDLKRYGVASRANPKEIHTKEYLVRTILEIDMTDVSKEDEDLIWAVVKKIDCKTDMKKVI